MSSLEIGGRVIGTGEPTYVVLEAGPTHDGYETACKLVDVAAQAGADAVKFQVVDADALVPDRELQFSYEYLADRETGRTEHVSESLWEILKRREMSREEWRRLAAYCADKGISFFSTATSGSEMDFLSELGVGTIKICSGDITCHHLLRLAAGYDWAVQVDTGGATLAEVEQGIEVLEAAGCDRIIVNHCPSGYPARLESINLRVLTTLQQMYPDYPVAFSDHTPGADMDIAAVALGAHMIEKTITLDRTIRSPEHIMSLEPDEAAAFVRTLRGVESALGSPRRLMTVEERRSRLVARRSVYAGRDIALGQVIDQADVAYARPGDGIPAERDGLVLGRKAKRDIARGDKLSFSDFE